MDIRALSQIAGGVSASASAVPVDTRALISEIAGNTSLNDGERTGLISVIAKADQSLIGASRSVILHQAQSLGIYLRNTSGSESFPRWSMMTALRSYGLNLQDSGTDSSSSAGALQSQLETIAQTSRGVSVDTAVAVAVRQVDKPAVAYEAPDVSGTDSGPRVEKIA